MIKDKKIIAFREYPYCIMKYRAITPTMSKNNFNDYFILHEEKPNEDFFIVGNSCFYEFSKCYIKKISDVIKIFYDRGYNPFINKKINASVCMCKVVSFGKKEHVFTCFIDISMGFLDIVINYNGYTSKITDYSDDGINKAEEEIYNIFTQDFLSAIKIKRRVK